jgi:hypothetical protein
MRFSFRFSGCLPYFPLLLIKIVLYSNVESLKKVREKSNRGGARVGAGRKPTGLTKEKVSVTVDRETWQYALQKWRGKASRLVEMLIRQYAGTGVADAGEPEQ